MLNMTSSKNYTLLVVDDDEDLRDLMYATFLRDGFKVFAAENSEQAFQIVKNNKIDLIVSDMRMPGGDGLSLIDKIRGEDIEMPSLIFVTGYTDVSVEECLARGALSVLPKPFNHKELLRSVKTSLNI